MHQLDGNQSRRPRAKGPTKSNPPENDRLTSVVSTRRAQSTRFEFIDENETLEGKRDVMSNQRLVRAHVMREIRKQQKSAKKQTSRSLPSPPSSGITDWSPPKKGLCSSTSSGGSSTGSGGPPTPHLTDPEALGTESAQKSPPQIIYHVCSHCWKPLDAAEDDATHSTHADVCVVDHDHWSGFMLAKRRPDPISKPWLTVANCFHAAGIGRTLEPEFQDSFAYLFYQFTILNTYLYPLEPVEIQAMCATSAITEGESAMLHALCFAGAMHLIASNLGGTDFTLLGQDDQHQKVAKAGLLHKAKALSLINKVLASPSDAMKITSIVTVSLLSALEGLGGNLPSAAIHTRGLVRMIELRGGLEGLSPNVVGDIYTGDTKTAIINLCKPEFALTKYWQQRVEQLSVTDFECSISDFKSLATRFFDPDLVHIFHPDMLRNFRFIRHLIKYTEFAKRKRGSQPIEGYTIGEFAVADHLLLSFPYEIHTVNTTTDQIQECCRIATLLYVNLALWRSPSYFSLVKALVRHLRKAIMRLDFSLYGKIYPDLLLWITFVGCYAAEGQPERSWFIINVADVSKCLGLRNWEEVRRLLIKFFYTERVLEVPYVKIWDEVSLILEDT